jgi:hypothetical protein
LQTSFSFTPGFLNFNATRTVNSYGQIGGLHVENTIRLGQNTILATVIDHFGTFVRSFYFNRPPRAHMNFMKRRCLQ